MDGGTFTISNGGVFGSLMGTPIINPPQSAILGMHGIFDHPVAVKGEVMMQYTNSCANFELSTLEPVDRQLIESSICYRVSFTWTR